MERQVDSVQNSDSASFQTGNMQLFSAVRRLQPKRLTRLVSRIEHACSGTSMRTAQPQLEVNERASKILLAASARNASDVIDLPVIRVYIGSSFKECHVECTS
jgi:hypothetical protein